MDEVEIGAALENLQAELAFQGETVRELNEALGAQQREILLIREQLAALGSQLRKLREAGVEAHPADDDQPPPHY